MLYRSAGSSLPTLRTLLVKVCKKYKKVKIFVIKRFLSLKLKESSYLSQNGDERYRIKVGNTLTKRRNWRSL